MPASIAEVQQAPPPRGIILNLESTGVILAIIISACTLAGIVVKIITQFNTITNTLKEIEEDLIKHIASEGHEKIEPKLRRIEELDKKVDLHIQDMMNRKEAVNMIANQLDQKINHKFSTLSHSMKDVESYLNKQGNFRIRQYHDERED